MGKKNEEEMITRLGSDISLLMLNDIHMHLSEVFKRLTVPNASQVCNSKWKQESNSILEESEICTTNK